MIAIASADSTCRQTSRSTRPTGRTITGTPSRRAGMTVATPFAVARITSRSPRRLREPGFYVIGKSGKGVSDDVQQGGGRDGFSHQGVQMPASRSASSRPPPSRRGQGKRRRSKARVQRRAATDVVAGQGKAPQRRQIFPTSGISTRGPRRILAKLARNPSRTSPCLRRGGGLSATTSQRARGGGRVRRTAAATPGAWGKVSR
jgi:hypothetical protein